MFYFKIVLSSHGHLWIHLKTISTTLTTLNELVCIIRTHYAFLSIQRTVRPCTRLGCLSFSTWPREQRFESNPLSWRQDEKWRIGGTFLCQCRLPILGQISSEHTDPLLSSSWARRWLKPESHPVTSTHLFCKSCR